MDSSTQDSFDEQLYLVSNPDVAKAVAQGRLRSGRQHYDQSGRAEGRVATAAEFVLQNALAQSEQRIRERERAPGQRLPALEALRTSIPMRVVRRLRRALRAPADRIRYATKLAWWMLTLQLVQQLNDRSRVRINNELLPGEDPMKGPRNGQEKPHFSPPSGDVCFAVPFAYPVALPKEAPSLAVVCHVFYPELLEEFKGYWVNIPFPFDLFITTDARAKAAAIREGMAGWAKGSVEVRVVPNRGRDIAPKLVSCRDVYDKYEFFLHLHSKKSLHAGVLTPWRQYLLDTLLGSREIVLSIFEAFEADPKLGMVAPDHFDPVFGHIGWGWNVRAGTGFAGELGITIPNLDKVDFPSGSMFWGRSCALQPLLDRALRTEDFSSEAKQIDGTLAHVIERMYYFVCEKAGYRWIKLLRPGSSRRAENVLSVHGRAELARSIVDTQFGLLVPSNEPATGPVVPVETGLHQGWRAVHANSDLRTLEFAAFCEELRKHIAGQASAIDFDESFYLAAHPDVAKEVARAHIPCGYVHYCQAGKLEGRIYSDRAIQRQFGVAPNWPGDIVSMDSSLLAPAVSLANLPDSEKPVLLILLSHLQESFFFAGYAEFFKDYVPVMQRFDRVVLAVQHAEYDESLAKRYLESIEVVPFGALPSLKHKPDVIVGFNAHLTKLAHEMMPLHAERVVYYCQDFESGFFPYSVDYVLGERAVANTRNLVVSTELLRKFLADRGLITQQDVHVTRPRIDVLEVPAKRSKRVFFYYRPEYFHRRNLPELMKEAAVALCDRHPDFEVFLVGSVAASYSYKVNGAQIHVLSKLPKQEYGELISSCDVVVSMIYSAHPGVIAFQAAASGIPTVTNVFDNRDATLLRRISENIVPYDPVRQNLIDCIEEALRMPKGRRSFDEALYSGQPNGSFVDFHLRIVQDIRRTCDETHVDMTAVQSLHGGGRSAADAGSRP